LTPGLVSRPLGRQNEGGMSSPALGPSSTRATRTPMATVAGGRYTLGDPARSGISPDVQVSRFRFFMEEFCSRRCSDGRSGGHLWCPRDRPAVAGEAVEPPSPDEAKPTPRPALDANVLVGVFQTGHITNPSRPQTDCACRAAVARGRAPHP
jgi:hypothetical protein